MWKHKKAKKEQKEDGVYLPDEMWLHIFSFLSVSDLTRSRSVCSHWNAIIMSDPANRERINAEKIRKTNFNNNHLLLNDTGSGYECCRATFGMMLAACCPWPFICIYMLDSKDDWKSHSVGCVMCAAVPCCCPCYACAGWGILLFT